MIGNRRRSAGRQALIDIGEAPFSRSPHSFETRPLRIEITDGPRGARLGAFGFSTTKVALGNLAGIPIVIHGPERTRNRTHLATDALRLYYNLGACIPIHLYGIHGARIHAPGLIALGAGKWCELPFIVKDENLDARFRRVEDPLFGQRTGHLALQATGAFLGLDVQETLHSSILLTRRGKFIEIV